MANQYVKQSIVFLAAATLVSATAFAGNYDKAAEGNGMESQQSADPMSTRNSDLQSSDAMSTESQQELGARGEMDSTGQDVNSTHSETMGDSDSMSDTMASQDHRGNSNLDTAKLSRDEIKKVQEALNKSESANLQTDGIVGSRTREALRSYQKDNDLQVTGVANQETLNSLGVLISSDTSATMDSSRRPASVNPATPNTPAEPEITPNSEMNPTPGSMEDDMEIEQSSPMRDDMSTEKEQSLPNNDSSVQSNDMNQEVN